MSFHGVLIALCLFASPALSAATPPGDEVLIIDGTQPQLRLGTWLYVLKDPGGRLTIDDVKSAQAAAAFTRCQSPAPNFGFSDAAYWFRFTVRRDARAPELLMLELAYPLMDYIELWTPGGHGGLERTVGGYRYPFAQRGNHYPTFVFPFRPPPGRDMTCYLRVAGQDRLEVPLVLWREADFQVKVQNESFLLGMYYGLILIIIVINLVFSVSFRDLAYLFNVFFMLAITLYQLTQDGLAYRSLVPASLSSWNHYVHITILLLPVTGILFFRTFLNMKELVPGWNRFLKWWGNVILLLVFLPLVISYSQTIFTILIVQVAGVLVFIYAAVAVFRKHYQPARYFIVSFAILLGFGMISQFKNMGYLPANLFTASSMHIGSALVFIVLTMGLGGRVNLIREEHEHAREEVILTQRAMVQQLTRTQEDIREAHRRVSSSEERYRLLVEGSHDIIFSLDSRWCFLTVNRAVKSHFNISPEAVIGQRFHEQLFEGTEERPSSKKFVIEKLEAFARDRNPMQFRAEFVSVISTEPKEMMVQLEYVSGGTAVEILGKASPVTEDVLMQGIEYERQVMSIGNYLVTADDVSQRMTRNLGRFLEPVKIEIMRIAIREMIVNAIEHGNLHITFDEKTAAIDDERYFEFVAARQADPRYRDRRVHIDFTIEQSGACFVIADQGEGFDYEAAMKRDVDAEDEPLMLHGRGIMMASRIFDEIAFADGGTRVTLVKRFDESGG